jgi:hypothetical protein
MKRLKAQVNILKEKAKNAEKGKVKETETRGKRYAELKL